MMTARKKSALALVLAACIGLALWLPTLGLNDLDDASSNETIFTRGPLVRILFDNKWDDQSPLFFAVLHFWQRAVGSDLFRIKFLNVLITLGTIAMIFALTRRMCGRRAPAAAAALLFAVSPLAGWYASVGRMYPMIALLTGLSALALLKYLENGRSSVAAAFVAFTALGAYNHFFGLWASGLLYLFWLGVALWRFNRDARRDGPLKAAVHGLVPWLSAAALFEMLILPQIIRAGMLTKDPPAYASGWSMPADTSKFFHLVAKFCFLNSAWPPELNVIEGALNAALLTAVLALCLRGLWTLPARPRALTILFTVVSVYAVHLIGSRLDLRDRYFVYITPFLFVALGAGLVFESPCGAGRIARLRLWTSRTVRAVLAVFIGTSFLLISYQKAQYRYPEWSRVMKALDVIVPAQTVCYMPVNITTGIPQFAAFKQGLRAELQHIRPMNPSRRNEFMREVKEGKNFAILVHRGRSTDERRWRAQTLSKMGYRLTVINGKDCTADLYTRILPKVLIRKSRLKAKATPEEIVSWASAKLKPRSPDVSRDRLISALTARVSQSGEIVEPGFVTTQNGFYPSWRFGNEAWKSVEYSRMSTGGIERKVIWAHPADKSTLVIAFPKVRLGNWLKIVHAVGGEAKGYALGTEIQVQVAADGKVISRFVSPNTEGWKTQAIDTARFNGTEADLVFLVTSASQEFRHFGFDLRTSSSKPKPVRSKSWAVLQPAKTVWSQRLHALKVFREKEGRPVAQGVLKADVYSASQMHEHRGPKDEGSMALHWKLGKEPWNAVGRTRQRSKGMYRDGIWAHPSDGTELVIRTRIKNASKLEGFTGFTDRSAEMSEKNGHAQPVVFRILADGKEIYKAEVLRGKGWKVFRADLPKKRSRRKTWIEVRISSADQKWAHFVFDIFEKI